MGKRRSAGPPIRFHLYAAVLVLFGMGLASVWALFLPMFLSPDEDSHYDYALTLYTAGRPMRRTESVSGRDTHPDVQYLMSATHAREQRLDPGVGADRHYGTRAYFSKLDAGAPVTLRSAYRNADISPVPYISRVYPVGYYALAALAIGLGGLATHGSLVASFFAVRFLSVFLLASTLTFGWLALLETGVGARRALLILAGIALFPMNAAISGSVQPDNLAAALIAPLSYCALRLRSVPTNTLLSTIAGLLFGLLVATKHHYFAAVFLPTAAMLGVRLPFRTQPGRAWRTVALLVVPALATFAVTEAVLVPASAIRGVCEFTRTPDLARRHGFGAAVHHAAIGFRTAFEGTFFNSIDFQSFWLNYTAYRRNTLWLGNRGVTAALQGTLPVLSGIVSLCFLLRIAQVRQRVFRIGMKRSWRTAAKIVTSNVVINGYLCFFAILFAFEISSGGVIPIQGRYWFPFLPGLWMCAFVVAPRFFRPSASRLIGHALQWSLVVFCLTATAYTFSSIHERFYMPLPPIAAKDEILADIGLHAEGGAWFAVGTAIDLRSASPVEEVIVRLDGGAPLAVRRVARPDVVCDAETTLLKSGFSANLHIPTLRRGKHRLSVFVRTPWSSKLIDSEVSTNFEVVVSAGPRRSRVPVIANR